MGKGNPGDRDDDVVPDRRVLVMDDFQVMSRSINQRVDGIIGEDVLREFDFVILDFKHLRLVLSH
jgi:hypothetical protein